MRKSPRQHERGAPAKGPAEREELRRRPGQRAVFEHAIAFAKIESAGPAITTVGERLVGQRGALGGGGRARGVVENRKGGGGAASPRARGRWLIAEPRHQLVEVDGLGSAGRDRRGGLIAESAVPEDQAWRDVGQDAWKIGPQHLGVERIDGRTVAQDAK